MNVRVKITRRRVKCFYCSQFIEAGEFQVVCVYFMRLKNNLRTWTKQMHFHAKDPYCWIDRAIIEVGQRHYSERRGRKASNLSDDSKAQRLKIMRRRASVIQRFNYEVETKRRPEKLSQLLDTLERLKAEITPYGGMPEKWK